MPPATTPSMDLCKLQINPLSFLSKTGVSGAARGMSRELAAQRDRQVRLASVQADLELDLPPHITLPDGEELPYGSSNRLQIRDPEQEREIYQKCIRPPPNRTVFDGESPPPYRSFSLSSTASSSTGTGVCCGVDFWSEVTSGTSPSTSSLSSSVVRCHSVSVPVPHRGSSSSRRLSAFSERHTGAGVPNSSESPALASLTMVPCHVPPAPSQQPTRATDSKRFI